MVKRKRKPEPSPQTVAVTSQLGIVQDKQAAGLLFDAILQGVRKANARVAREKEESDNAKRRAS